MSMFGDDNFDDNEVDPAAEFLAREQSQLAGLEDDLNPVVQQSSPVPAAVVVNGAPVGKRKAGSADLKPSRDSI